MGQNRKTRVMVLSDGVVTLRIFTIILTQYWHWTDRWTDRIAITILHCACSADAKGLESCSATMSHMHMVPRVGSGVVRIDPLSFLARCRKKLLNQALSVLSLSLGFLLLCVVLITSDSF